MKKEFKGNANKGGVYQIRNLKNEKIYIGSAKCFKKRAAQHQQRLNVGRHYNKHLLSSWDKYGSNSFLFEILEVAEGTTRQRRIIEEKYIKQFLKEGKKLYNKTNKTIKKIGPWSHNPEETKKKMSKASKKRWKNATFREKVIRSLKKSGSKKDFRKRMSYIVKETWGDEKVRTSRIKGLRKNAKTYIVISPIGKEINITNLQQFCFENKLSQRVMRHIVAGTKISYKGWRIKNGPIDRRFKTYSLIDPNGKHITITNLRTFCKKENIKYSGLQSVVYGRQRTYNGYSLAPTKNKRR